MTIEPAANIRTAWSTYVPGSTQDESGRPTSTALVGTIWSGVEKNTVTPMPAQPQSSSVTSTSKPTQTISPQPSPTPTTRLCFDTSGQLEFGSLETEFLRLPLSYRVYLPACYDQDIDRRYPVLYLFHGQGFKDDQWDRIGADETADRLIANGEIPPLIIVMPYERNGGQPGESNFDQVLVEQLVPHIDETYRTKSDPNQRAVGGLSRGGGWAIHFAMKHWKVFGALGGHSPAVFFADAEQMRSFIDAIPLRSYPRIYLDIGVRDRPEILRAAFWFEQLLNEKDVPHEWHLFSGYHNEEYWSAHMAQYLRWYTQGW